MKPNRNDHKNNSTESKVCAVFAALALVALLFTADRIWAQASTSSTSAQSDPTALAVITKSLTAMGGETNWQRIGAATTVVSVSRPGVTARIIQWADDWHLGYDLSRRDSHGANGQTTTMISLKDHRIYRAGGSPHTLPHENDLAVLAVGYPAAALTLSLQRSGCVFHSVSAYDLGHPAAGTETVDEDCNDLFFATTAHLIWTFSTSTGLPTQVRLPVRLLVHNGVAYETAQFTQFANEGNVQAPSEVTLALPSGQTIEFQLGPRSFTSSLPTSTFSIP